MSNDEIRIHIEFTCYFDWFEVGQSITMTHKELVGRYKYTRLANGWRWESIDD